MKTASIGLYLLLFVFGITLIAHPHALDPNSMDRHAEITFTAAKLIVIYQVICGMNQTEQYTNTLDADNNGTITDEERTAFVRTIAAQYAKHQIVHIGEHPLSLQYHNGDTYATTGHNGINVIKIDVAYTAEYPANVVRNVTHEFYYEDQNFQTVLGWKQLNIATRNDVSYSGYIPYQEYAPFDYEIMTTKGFTPATEKLKGEVKIPSAENSGDAEIVMPVKHIPQETMKRDDFILISLAYGLAGLLVMIVILIGVRAVRMRR